MYHMWVYADCPVDMIDLQTHLLWGHVVGLLPREGGASLVQLYVP
jgi:hypothetical protein